MGEKTLPPVGTGENTVIQNAIIDQNARIGDNGNFSIRDGITVVHKNGVIPATTVI